jgi:hypothetical protein
VLAGFGRTISEVGAVLIARASRTSVVVFTLEPSLKGEIAARHPPYMRRSPPAPRFVYILCVPAGLRARRCVHHLEMSLFLPFRNVTAIGVGRCAGAEPPRSAVDGSAFAAACDHATAASIIHNRNVSRPSVIP